MAVASEIELMEALRDARAQGQPWHRLGRILQERFDGDGTGGRQTATWEAAEQATGLKPVILRRILALTHRLDRVSQESGVPVSDLVASSYGAVELALRLYDRDQDAGLRALAELRERKTTIEELQRKVLETPAGSADPGAAARSTALVERAKKIRDCETAISRHVRRQLGGHVETVRRPVLKHFHRIGFEAVADDRILAGIDLHLPELPQVSKDSPDGLARSLLLARHLPLFELAFAPGTALETAQDAAATAALLGMDWVGVVTIDADGGVTPVHPQAPNPDLAGPKAYPAIRAAFMVGRKGAK